MISLVFCGEGRLDVGPQNRETRSPKRLRHLKMKNFVLLTGAILISTGLVRAAAPPNDNFANRISLSGTNLTRLATNVAATREAGEPQHFSSPTSNSVWYTWTAPSSGGAVVTVTNTSFNVDNPVLAVYTGSSLASLVRLSSNSTDANDARVVFTAAAGQAYQIVFDAIALNDNGQGIDTMTLNLSPPPANDQFSNSIPIPGAYYQTNGSFIGASRETGEPSHGDATLGQTLWWSWTAPTNGPNPLPMRIMADAVSFPPGVGVYSGNSVSSLTPVSLSLRTNGMSSEVTFSAAPGGVYHIALAGQENNPNTSAPLTGYFRFRLNERALALTITNLTAITNADGSVAFQAKANVQNLSSLASGPLRVSLSAISGLSTTQLLTAPPASSITNLGTTNQSALAAGQAALIPIGGTAPAPDTDDVSTPIAYGVYAELQEQEVSNRWFTVDESLVTFDNWPGIGQIFGPGGGVIRLDPSYVGLSAFDPLQSVKMSGAASVTEGSSAAYLGSATYADGTIQNFSNTTWSASLFTITTNGVFTTGSVTSNTTVSVMAAYSCAGFLYSASSNVIVLNLPPPSITGLKLLTNGTLTLSLTGVPGRSHVIEAASNLFAPVVWVPLNTNAADGAGHLTVSNLSRAGFSQRFYRAREFP